MTKKYFGTDGIRGRVGVYPITPLYDPQAGEARPDRAGLVMGYAALDTARIERGVQLLAQAVRRVGAVI